MGKDLYDAYPAFDLKTLCFEGPAQQLADTRYTQPCMVAFAAGVTAVLQQAGIVPAAVAGLSLGEYSALCAAGVFTAPAATALAAFRGHAMATAVTGRACGMAAILGLGREALKAVCQTASSAGVVQIANYNCPGQLVIGGRKALPAAGGVRPVSHFADGPGGRRTARPACRDAAAKTADTGLFQLPWRAHAAG